MDEKLRGLKEKDYSIHDDRYYDDFNDEDISRSNIESDQNVTNSDDKRNKR